MRKFVFLLLMLLLLVLLVGAFIYILLVYTTVFNKQPPSATIVPTSTVSPSPVQLNQLIETVVIVPEQFKTGVFAQERRLKLPQGFKISVFASGFSKPRHFTIDAENNFYLANMNAGEVLLLRDTDNDGIADFRKVIDNGLNKPSDTEFYKGDLYVTTETTVYVYKNILSDGSFTEKKAIISNIPAGGHVTRTIVIAPDDKIYLSVGSSCNVCVETDASRAAVSSYNLDGSGGVVFASGLRNSVGLFVKKSPDNDSYQLWSVDNGRDNLGDLLPPEEVNILEAGKNYGWPYCYGKRINNPEFLDRAEYCASQTTAPVYEMHAHTAPLDIVFMQGEGAQNFPPQMADLAFVSQHGSWNSSVLVGYKLIFIDTADAANREQDFVTGWASEGKAWGRPVGLGFDSKGIMYISDDSANVIYKLEYQP